MKNIFNIMKFAAVSALIAATATSCLEKYPGSSIPEGDAMKTFADAEQHIVGIYASLKGSGLYSGNLTLLPDIQADLVMATLTNSNPYNGIWNWEIRPSNEYTEAVYGSLYSVIGNCNFYLEKVGDVIASETSEERLELLDTYTAEAYTIRALCYSELIKCYCEAYDPDRADEQLGVVLRTKYSEPEPVVRASLKASYEQVLSDLSKAEELFDDGDEDPESNALDEPDNYYISPAAVYAIRARVALYMENWDDAIKYSTYVINNEAFELSGTTTASNGYPEFDNLWFYDTGSELIWRIGFTATSYGGALGTVFLHYNTDLTYAYPDYVPAEWVLNLYSSSDLRYLAYFRDATGTGIPCGYDYEIPVPYVVKYYGNRNFTSSYNLYHVCMPKPLRLAEQYLIRAEAYCRNNRTDLAAADLTTLSQSRGGGSISINTSSSSTDFNPAYLQTISDERVKELYMEGFRLNDLKRWGAGFTRTPNSYSQKEGNDLEISADNPQFVWPIPQNDMDAPGSDIEGNESNNL